RRLDPCRVRELRCGVDGCEIGSHQVPAEAQVNTDLSRTGRQGIARTGPGSLPSRIFEYGRGWAIGQVQNSLETGVPRCGHVLLIRRRCVSVMKIYRGVGGCRQLRNLHPSDYLPAGLIELLQFMAKLIATGVLEQDIAAVLRTCFL